MKKVFKYATGVEIPEGAVYLSTQVETETIIFSNGGSKTLNFLVWHYFLVEVEASNWICGKCTQEEKGIAEEEQLPMHTRRCPKRHG